MTKIKRDAAYSLIKRLSKSEKWQFAVYSKRYAERDKLYYRLFKELSDQKQYNEEKLLQIDGVTKVQLPNLKSNLYKQLLQYLSSAGNSIQEKKAASNLNGARFLYNKCLYSDCLILIDKGKQEARKGYQLLVLLELLELEKLTILQTSDSKISERIDVIIDEIAETTKQLNNVNLYSNLAIKLNALYQTIGFIRSKEDLQMVRTYYDEHFPITDLRNLSLIELIYLYSTVTGFYLFIQNFDRAYKYSKKLLSAFESNYNLMTSHTEMYIKAINYVLVCQNKLQLLPEFRETHKKLIVLKRNKELLSNQNIALNLFKAIYIHEMNKHFMMGEFKQGTKIVAALEKEIEKFMTILNKNTILIFYYKIAALYFGSEQYKMALKWLNKIINEKIVELREDIQSFARILELICYYELDDQEMMEYKIRSTYRFLLKRQNFVKYQLYIMQFLRSMRPYQTKRELFRHFQKLKTNMEKLENNRFEKRAFIYFDIISWLESKLENKSIQDVIKEKLNKHLDIAA